MTIYRTQLTDIPSANFTQPIICGTTSLMLHFLWDTTNQEQYDILDRALGNRSKADPLLKGSNIIRDYDYFTWYLGLPSSVEQITEMLENGMEYPQSLRNLPIDMIAMQLYDRRLEVAELQTSIQPLVNQLVWSVEITDGNTVKTGVVQPGGWIGNQDLDWRVQFQSDLESIGYEDLLNVVIRIEVADD